MNKTIHCCYKEGFDYACNLFNEKKVPFEAKGFSISIPEEHAYLFAQISFAYFISLGHTISITNNSGDFFGHTKDKPFTCPEAASEALRKAKLESRSWYHVINDTPKH
tara:strand:- start:496 stop:819 length:324 start_codon:yes stop_codon:yes gene_type:complete